MVLTKSFKWLYFCYGNFKNAKIDQLAAIFDENNQNYVSDRDCLFDDNFLKLVAVENDEAIGYLVAYLGKDFIEKEDYPIKLNFDRDVIYIWNGITKKGFEGRGVQTKLLNYLFKEYPDYDIYSVVDQNNEASIRLHSKMKFEKILNFDKEYDGELEHYCLQRRSNEIERDY